jgi:hypothetical protein
MNGESFVVIGQPDACVRAGRRLSPITGRSETRQVIWADVTYNRKPQ